MKMVLQKFIAEAGYCSRRQAEELIRKSVGAQNIVPIQVNGQPAELGMKVDENDDVRIYGQKIILNKEKIYIMLNKPVGYVCTNRKFKGERNIFDLLSDYNIFADNKIPSREGWRGAPGCVTVNHGNTPRPSGTPFKRGRGTRLFTVGRLDKDSQGLVLLTNDGDLTQKLQHPRYEHEKKYVVKVKSQNAKVKSIEENLKGGGVDIGEGDGVAKVKRIKYLGSDKFEIVLTQGKKRQIRRMLQALGCEAADLVRTSLGSLELGDLKSGQWRYLNQEEIKKLHLK
jgi:23S rRNA pseudouridine2605 synthase